MKRICSFALAVALLGSTAAIAQPGQFGTQDRYEGYRGNPGVRMASPRYSRGDRVPDQYRHNQQYAVDDWRARHLRKPPRGYRWVRDDNNNYFLAAAATGLILDLLLNAR